MSAKGSPARFYLEGFGRAAMAKKLHDFIDLLSATESWVVEIKRHAKTRSSAQNRYLWGVCYAVIAESTGQPAEDWHEFFLGEMWGWNRVQMMGRTKLKPARRSSKLSRAEFADYVDFIHRRAAEHGIYIPSPGEHDYDEVPHRRAA